MSRIDCEGGGGGVLDVWEPHSIPNYLYDILIQKTFFVLKFIPVVDFYGSALAIIIIKNMSIEVQYIRHCAVTMNGKFNGFKIV